MTETSPDTKSVEEKIEEIMDNARRSGLFNYIDEEAFKLRVRQYTEEFL